MPAATPPNGILFAAVGALAPAFWLFLASRVLSALACAAFLSRPWVSADFDFWPGGATCGEVLGDDPNEPNDVLLPEVADLEVVLCDENPRLNDDPPPLKLEPPFAIPIIGNARITSTAAIFQRFMSLSFAEFDALGVLA